VGNFSHPDICWRDSAAGHKQSGRFLGCADDNFLFEVIEEPARRGAMLDLVLTNKEGLVGKVKAKGSLDCSDHEIVEFKILRAVSRVHNKLTALDFRRADSGLFRDLLGRVPWDKALEGRGAKKNSLIFKDHLLQSSGVIHPNKEEVGPKCQVACMDEQGVPGQTQTQKRTLERVEARTGSLGGVQRNCPSSRRSG